MRKILQSSVVVLAVLLCAPAAGLAAGRTSYSGSSERRVLTLLNDIRHEHGLSRLQGSEALRAAARQHSGAMEAHGYFEHTRPTETFDTRIRRFLDSPLVGENIAWGTGSYATPQGIVGLWMHSRAHRHIILMPSLHRVGLGVARGSFQHTPGAMTATADFSS
jgi:uncharacterized protein YkwD